MYRLGNPHFSLLSLLLISWSSSSSSKERYSWRQLAWFFFMTGQASLDFSWSAPRCWNYGTSSYSIYRYMQYGTPNQRTLAKVWRDISYYFENVTGIDKIDENKRSKTRKYDLFEEFCSFLIRKRLRFSHWMTCESLSIRDCPSNSHTQ